MYTLVNDLRYGVRVLFKTPLLSSFAILTIALGVGLTTQTFSIVYGSVMRGPELEGPEPLLHVSTEVHGRNRGGWIPYRDLVDFRDGQRSFRGLAAYRQGTVNLADEGSKAERYQGGFVSANLFDQLDVRPIHGSTFTEADDDGAAAPSILLSHHVWQNRFGGDPSIVGKTLRANGLTHVVAGIMPLGFRFPFSEDVWLPLGIDPLTAERGADRVAVVGRLLPGVSLEQATQDLNQIASQIASAFPATNENVGVWVQDYTDYYMPTEITTVLWVMLTAVFGVLLIACFNVANLLLARAAVRSKEVAVRSALGASRKRLIGQLFMEASVLTTVGGAIGIGLAVLGISAFNASILDITKPYWIDIRLDTAAVLFTVGITAIAAVVAGTLPAVRASGGLVHDILKDSSRGSSGLRLGRISSALVISEIGLSCALLIGAGMMVKSVVNLKSIDLGFAAEGIFTSRMTLDEIQYPTAESRVQLQDQLLEALRSRADVGAATLATSVPVLGSGRPRFAVEGQTYASLDDYPYASLNRVSPGFFEVLGLSPTEGRTFGSEDRADALATVILSESFARQHFPDGALGRRIRLGTRDSDQPWLTVVGIVPDTYVGTQGAGGIGADKIPPEQFFVPLAQQNARSFAMLVRTQGEPANFSSAARDVVSSIDPDLPIYEAGTMEEAIQSATWAFGLFGSLFSAFGVVALFLAGVGLYGVMAFSVGRRAQEMGIRMALGANHGSIIGLVLKKGIAQMGIGALIGLSLGALMARPMSVVFYDVTPNDPLVYTITLATLALAGLLACWVPARRATKVTLTEALRPE